MRIRDMPLVRRIWILGLVMIFLAKLYSLIAPEGYPVLRWPYWTLVAVWAAVMLVVAALVGESQP